MIYLIHTNEVIFMTNNNYSVRLNPADREEASRLLNTIGISFNSYVTMAVKQLIIQGQIPFEIKAHKDEYPNELTRMTMVKTEAEEAGLIPDTAKEFSNSDEAMRFLFEEDRN